MDDSPFGLFDPGTAMLPGAPRRALLDHSLSMPHAAPPQRAAARGRRQARARRRFKLPGAVWIAAAGIAGAVVFGVLTHGGEAARSDGGLLGNLDRIAVRLGFGITQVQLHGQRYTSDSEIYRQLGLEPDHSQLSFDTSAAARRLEQLGWIRSAQVRRALPDGLEVEVIERVPFALFRHDGRSVLIDASGRALAAVTGSDVGLPVVTGEGADTTAAEVIGMVAAHVGLRQRLIEARRVAGRRWTLVLADGPLVHLPALGASHALSRLLARAPGLVDDRTLAEIDLRTAGRMIVRRTGGGIERPTSAGVLAEPAATRTQARGAIVASPVR